MARLKIARSAGVADLGADMDPFLLHLYAALAEKERALITARTKAALAAPKPRVTVTGQKKHPEVKRLGNPNGAAPAPVWRKGWTRRPHSECGQARGQSSRDYRRTSR